MHIPHHIDKFIKENNDCKKVLELHKENMTD